MIHNLHQAFPGTDSYQNPNWHWSDHPHGENGKLYLMHSLLVFAEINYTRETRDVSIKTLEGIVSALNWVEQRR